jgi:putrescine transport system substrate-binding protein
MLDRAKIPNAEFLDPAALTYTDILDPSNSHSVPYMWGTVGMGVNKEKVRAIRPDAPLNSLALMLDPAIAADVSKCGIAVIDEPIDVIPAFVAYLGGDMKNIGITDLEAVEVALSRVSDYIKVVSVDSYINSLSEGNTASSGAIRAPYSMRAISPRQMAGTIVYNVPKEGSQLWFDLFVIPNKSQNKDRAYQLLNYMLKPEGGCRQHQFPAICQSDPDISPLHRTEAVERSGALSAERVEAACGAAAHGCECRREAELKRIWSS